MPIEGVRVDEGPLAKEGPRYIQWWWPSSTLQFTGQGVYLLREETAGFVAEWHEDEDA